MILTDFLLARIAEDEQRAQDLESVTYRPRWTTQPETGRVLSTTLLEDWKGRALAECEAKRRIVEEHADYGGYGESCQTCVESDIDLKPWPCPTLRALALPYADRPDYHEEWRP